MANELDIRYIAGLFDGEGCITLRIQRYRDKRWPKNRAVQRRCVFCMHINMVDPRALRKLAQQHGGFFKKRRKPAKPTHRPLHMWVLANQQAHRLLRQLVPYLVIKKEEALVALEFQDHMTHRKNGVSRGPRVTDAEWAIREHWEAELKRLKRVIYE